MISWLFKTLFGNSNTSVCPVPGAGVYKDKEGRVIYNMLDPTMAQFMGRCVGAIKKSGLRAKGTKQFSVIFGSDFQYELMLDSFWKEYSTATDDAQVLDAVVIAARKMSQ